MAIFVNQLISTCVRYSVILRTFSLLMVFSFYLFDTSMNCFCDLLIYLYFEVFSEQHGGKALVALETHTIPCLLRKLT